MLESPLAAGSGPARGGSCPSLGLPQNCLTRVTEESSRYVLNPPHPGPSSKTTPLLIRSIPAATDCGSFCYHQRGIPGAGAIVGCLGVEPGGRWGGTLRTRWAGLAGGARYKMGLAGLAQACWGTRARWKVGLVLVSLLEVEVGFGAFRSAVLLCVRGSACPRVPEAWSRGRLSRARAQGRCLGPLAYSGWNAGIP